MTAFIESLAQTLPPVFSRSIAAAHLKGIYSAGHLANLDCEGVGPESVLIGRTVCYEKETFLQWLAGRMKPRKGGKVGAQKGGA